ncbi:hypothetical protein AVEN_225655-1 [Araneus ventricosus]|uniref:Uncharacterized protein n=1 Tax=Araneus ventricosus TaxID=182803 RepID=A0A4Y2L2N3_ARAVE|nr:hypothetical protein AVEN_225655-1 [Araneus ventricosus]
MIMLDLIELGLSKENFGVRVLERMDWSAQSLNLNPKEHVWDYLGRQVAAESTSPRSLNELEQALFHEWSFDSHFGVR